METLNQHVQLYGAMERLWSDERLVASFTPEQYRVAYTFVKEMQQHGISQTAIHTASTAGGEQGLLVYVTHGFVVVSLSTEQLCPQKRGNGRLH